MQSNAAPGLAVEEVSSPLAESLAEAALPTRSGGFRIRAFRVEGYSKEIIALLRGDQSLDEALVRLHSQCLTGDVLGSLRCDCGEQLQASLQELMSAPRGVLLYLPDEGRGIGIVNKIRAYALQDGGLDTVDANLALGLPIDGRDYSAAVLVLKSLGVKTVSILTNNPTKVQALEAAGIEVKQRIPVIVEPNSKNVGYLQTKVRRMGHLMADANGKAPRGKTMAGRGGAPRITVHYAQTLDGRIATQTGQSRWISGEKTLAFAHQLRADHEAVMVGVGTVRNDNPQLTVRLVKGRSPVRVIVDSRLRIPDESQVLTDHTVRTIVATTPQAAKRRVEAIRDLGVDVLVVEEADGMVDLRRLLGRLQALGIRTVLTEGGARLITSLLQERLVDRLVVCIAPKVIGRGIEAVGDLNVLNMSEALSFSESTFTNIEGDVIFDGHLARSQAEAGAA